MASMKKTFSDLILNSDKKFLESEKKKALLEQHTNVQNYKKNLAKYKAKMGAMGVAGFSPAVEEGFKNDLILENNKISNGFNFKINQLKENRKKDFINSGMKAVSSLLSEG